MVSANYSVIENLFLENLEKFKDSGLLAVRYKPMRSTGSLGSSLLRSVGVLPIDLRLNGEDQQLNSYKSLLNLDAITGIKIDLFGSISDLSNLMQQDILSSFPNLYDRFYFILNEKQDANSHFVDVMKAKAQFPSVVNLKNGQLGLRQKISI